ncbi:hypothetical protein T11_9994 [Trichinella zimbabwensis]|uniref:Uncharacterized protein n=1 Tax=Trichinella zimbabwensis TaxID=268475 RepID=A0A0V1HSI2_9BILA|nr:hypothetical protein T11_9994 [Trichinella zimbabwensis]
MVAVIGGQVVKAPPFSHNRMDFTGHCSYEWRSEPRRRVTRAVHSEVVPQMTTTRVLQILWIFVASDHPMGQHPLVKSCSLRTAYAVVASGSAPCSEGSGRASYP